MNKSNTEKGRKEEEKVENRGMKYKKSNIKE